MAELYLKIGNSRLTYWKGSGLGVSVVPKISKKFPGIKFVKAKDIPIRLPYKKGIGVDRVLNVFSASRLFPETSFLVVDFGTATTFEFFHSRKGYLGGWIAPSANLMTKALSQETSLLPHINVSTFKKMKRTGRSSKDSIQLGVQNSLLGSVDRALEVASQILGSQSFRLIVTGGGAQPLLKDLRSLVAPKRFHYEPLLLLRGLKFLHHDKLV